MADNSFSQEKKNQIFIFLMQTKTCSWFPPKNPKPVSVFLYELQACSDFFFFPGEVEQQ